jgi:hypothetical protein
VATVMCARCKTEVGSKEVRADPQGRTYHRMCYDIAYPDQAGRDAGLTITGIDIPFFDLV